MSRDRFPDRLSLIGMRFEGRHGVLTEEKQRLQRFEVDVVLHADLSEAADRDDLSATADYAAIHELVRAIVTGPSVDLIEALAGAIARAVLAATDPRIIDAAEIRVRKPDAPIAGAEFDAAEVSLVRRRPGGG